ncbi:MAG: hypothetical protein C3F17_16250 [Bradyrhizobiaceae bacterium]|nr:MAG: hypothetical protein C3F17_16250 [Bradyrhizobiaceae bacterium]
MKVAINTRPLDGPWGGGNRFVQSLAETLQHRGHQVAFELDDRVDLALIIDPRRRNPQLSFTPGQAMAQQRRHPELLIVHRINECDERKGTSTINARLRWANYCADHTVFIASWLRDLDLWRRESDATVILNGADERIFRRGSARTWDVGEPLRIVTHHWGAHANKGWDVYRKVDALAGEAAWRDRIHLTCIGNLPADVTLANSTRMPPLDGAALAAALADHHVYLSASVNEPAGMHHIEGALVGLPLIYRRSGALPEYCEGYGEPFDGPSDVAAALTRMLASYPGWKRRMAAYPHTAERMSHRYVDLFERLHADRSSIAARRRPWRAPVTAMLARISP